MAHRFSDIVDLPLLQGLMDSLYRVTKVPAAIVDLDGVLLLSTGLPLLCELYHRQHPEKPQRCFPEEQFVSAGEGCPEEGRWRQIRCDNDLIDYAFPVWVDQRCAALLLVGPLLHHPAEDPQIRDLAAALGVSVQRCRELANEVFVVPQEEMSSVLDFYADLVGVLTEMALQAVRHLEAQQAAERSELRFRDLFTMAADGIAITDLEGRMLEANPSMCSLLGFSHQEFLSGSLHDYVPPERVEQVPNRIREILDQGVGLFETGLQHKDGRTVPVEIRGKIMKFDDRPVILGQVRDLTERKKSEAMLKSILLAAPMSVGLVQDRVINWVNHWMVEELGYSEAELIGQSARMLYDSDEEFERVGTVKYNQMAHKQMGEIATQFKCRDGSMIDVLLRSAPLDPEDLDAGVIFTALNISEITRVENELRDAFEQAETARQQMNAILRSVTAGLLVIDQHGQVYMANPAAEQLLSLDMADMIGQQVAGLIDDLNFLERVRLALVGAEEQSPIELTRAGPEKEKPLILQTKVASVKELPGNVRGAVAILRDVTREHAINQLKDEFISTAAHELRTPMTSILGYTELMLDKIDVLNTDQLTEFLQIVFERSEALSQIISDMLDLSRVQSGRLISLEKFPGDLADLVRQMLPSYEYNSSGCKVRLVVDEALPLLLFDPRKMTQVFDNLLSNAVKFSPEGGEVVITLRALPDGLVVDVRDRGVGMSADQVERVFDKFYRVDYSNTAVSGLGLGMTLVRSIVEGHDGKIWVESELGKGTTVSFTLPGVPKDGGSG